MRILGISGSLRADSHNTKVLRAAADLVEPDVELRLFDALKEVPPFDEDDEHGPEPEGVARLRAALAGADAILFATPEYNSSVPGQLKNALDWASRPLRDNVLRFKPVAVVGASTGAFGAVWAQAELRKVLAASGARVVETEVAVNFAHRRFDDAGRLTDEGLREQLRSVVHVLAGETRAVADQPQPLAAVAA